MKRIPLITVLFTLLLSLTACSDKGISEDGNTPVQQQGQYLVMFYGIGGGNLDGSTIACILRSLNAGSSDKVKMTYEYRFSKEYQDNEKCKNIIRFTADENKHLVGKVNRDSISLGKKSINTFLDNVKTTHFGSPDYSFASDTALTSFIKWSKTQYPDANETILILSDHGDGWNLQCDGKNNVTRGILIDDNTDEAMSLWQVKAGISNAGNVDLLYTDACQMSMWENLVGYSSVAKFYIGSYEPVLALNYEYLINRLNAADVTDEDLYKVSCGYVDDIVDKWWPKMNIESYGVYTDIEAYDLRKIDEPLNVLSDVSKSLVSRYISDEQIPGVTEDKLSFTNWRSFINECIRRIELSTVFATYENTATFNDNEIPQPMFAILDSLGCKRLYDEKAGKYLYSRNDVLRALKLSDYDDIINGSYTKLYKDLWELLSITTADSYCIADMLIYMSDLLKKSGSTDNTFSLLSERYIKALQDFGHIRCTFSDPSVSFYEYKLCSPGIFIFPLNEKAYTEDNLFAFRHTRYIPSAAEALKCYQATDFDKKVLWSEFLKLLEVVPNVIDNPSREEIR